MRKTEELAKKLQGGLIVSCQVQPDDPCYSIDFVVKMAKSAAWGGAVGLRANSPDQIAAIKKEVDLPLIGLYKIWHDDTDVFITPTLESALEVWEAGADIIALDCTDQITHEGRPAYFVGPTLYGYTKDTMHITGPDFREFARMCRDFKGRSRVIMEGHIYTPEDAMKVLYLGAHSVVVGSAITRPHLITARFVDLLSGYGHDWRKAETSHH